MIPRYTDVDQFFSISEDGMITTNRPLDRETQPWHNISISATEIGMYIKANTPNHQSLLQGNENNIYPWT